MTGDDHTSGGDRGSTSIASSTATARLLGRRLGLRALHLVRLHGQRHDRGAGGGLPGPGLRDRAASGTPVAPTSPRTRCARTGRTSCPTSSAAGPVSSSPRAQTERTASRGATGRARATGGARSGRSAGEANCWAGVGSRTGPGMFTGSGIPMRFADLDGSLIDVYQGDDADHGRVGHGTSPRTSRPCSIARSAPRATTARSR